MHDPNLTDSELMVRVASGEETALGVLYDRFGRLVYSMAYNILGDHSMAEEVTQDVFIRVWEKAETYRPEAGRVAGWLTRLSRNRAIDVYRGLRVRPEGNLVGFAIEDADQLPAAHNVEESAEIRHRRHRVRQALGVLPAEQREALTYAFLKGYSHGEIAGALGQPLGTIKTRIRLGMQKLRDLLSEEVFRE